MHELEQAANSRDDKGFLKFQGRMGFRALQEILELDLSADLTGISLTIVGEANPVLDTRVELRGLREDFSMRATKQALPRLAPKISSGDTIIRDQFKHFLRQMDFHKGVYFLTSDKTNAALAKTEGLHSVYYKTPPWYKAKEEVKLPGIPCKPGPGQITIAVPLGKLIYELAVQFGRIKVGWDTEETEIACDGKGESLDRWILKDLRIKDYELKKLLRNYESTGKFPLDHVKKMWNDLSERLTGVEVEELSPQ